MDINKKRASYLYERNYENDINENLKEHYYWEEINGTSNIEYLYKKYSNSIRPFLNGNNCYTTTIKTYNEKLVSFYQNGLYKEEKFELSVISDKIFYPFYVPFTKLSLYWIKTQYSDSVKWKETLKNSCILCLIERLESICIRTLISEISLCKEDLKGENGKEEYLYYMHMFLNDESYIEEIFQAYPLGGKLILANMDSITDGSMLKEVLAHHNVNTMWMTSTLFNQMVQFDVTIFDRLNYLLIGGEKLSEKHVRVLKAHNTDM